MYVLVVFLSLISVFFSLIGRFFGNKNIAKINIFCLFLSFLISVFIFFEIVFLNSIVVFKLFNWLDISLYRIEWGFLFDSVTSVMLVVVLSISFLVHLYSYEYMGEDPHLCRFMSYLSLFTFFMLILITSDNFLQLFLGWEGVGLCSYLLISFWFTRLQANKSAIKAIIVNKIGDCCIIIALICILNLTLSLDYSIVFSMIPYFKDDLIVIFGFVFNKISFISLMLFLGAMGKSAQLGLHTWLPDAMEGPTPVSALIHAATMVTAGVFVIIRCSLIFEYSANILFFITLVGALTAFFAATVGMLQNDLKKVIAYSTCSQLGYMVFACGLSGYNVSLFHLFNHAFFKALLFLSAGSIIHALGNEQDMRRMGGLLNVMPFTYVMFLIGSLSLAGFPFLTGFYSKDVILELASTSYNIEGIFAFWLGSISAFFTAFYSFRLIYFTFFAETNVFKSIFFYVHEIPLLMGIPLGILAIFSIFFGFIFKDLFIGLGNITFGNSIYILPENYKFNTAEFIEYEFYDYKLKLIPLIFSFFGIFLVIILNKFFSIYLFYLKKSKIGYFFFIFLSKKWFFDLIFNYFLVLNLLKIGFIYTFKFIDKGIIELLGPEGFTSFFLKFTKNIIEKNQNGLIFNYIFFMFLGILVFICIIILQNYIFFFINKYLFIYLFIFILFEGFYLKKKC